MDLIFVFLIAFGLSADCFAVALSTSIANRNMPLSLIARVAVAFGLFQFLMPLAGWLVGEALVNVIAAYDHWAAFALAAFIGVVAFMVTGTGFFIGKGVNGLSGKTARMIGGLILIGIGIRVLLSHLL